jgi:hypothetical protein
MPHLFAVITQQPATTQAAGQAAVPGAPHWRQRARKV